MTLKIDSIGVMLDDSRPVARLFRFCEIVTWRIGPPTGGRYGLFEPLDDKGARIVHPVQNFWPLIDSL